LEPLCLPQPVARLVGCFAVDGSLTKIFRDDADNEFVGSLRVDLSELMFTPDAYTDHRRISSERKGE